MILNYPTWICKQGPVILPAKIKAPASLEPAARVSTTVKPESKRESETREIKQNTRKAQNFACFV
jgi:hypothetical protein